jgi:putative transposase
MLPREYPPWQTVYYHLRKWRRDGRLRQAHDRLRATVRESEGRNRDPSGAVLDSQVVRTTGVVGPERGYDGELVSKEPRSATGALCLSVFSLQTSTK